MTQLLVTEQHVAFIPDLVLTGLKLSFPFQPGSLPVIGRIPELFVVTGRAPAMSVMPHRARLVVQCFVRFTERLLARHTMGMGLGWWSAPFLTLSAGSVFLIPRPGPGVIT